MSSKIAAKDGVIYANGVPVFLTNSGPVYPYQPSAPATAPGKCYTCKDGTVITKPAKKGKK